MIKFIDRIGQKFGKLEIIDVVIEIIRNKHVGFAICTCDCGNNKKVRVGDLTSGRTKSCGCAIGEILKKRNLHMSTHNMAYHPRYYAWNKMLDRCYNKKNKDYKSYGGRGIKVCKRWHDVKNFIEYTKGWGLNGNSITIDRIDNNGDYSPDNCRPATRLMQANNKINNFIIEYNGRKETLANWARILNIKYTTLFCRIKKYEWSIEKAFTTPARKNGSINNER